MIPTIERLGNKYSFNREINDLRIKKEKILLPIDEEENVNYEFMEKYVKNIIYKKIKKYIENKKV